MGNNYILTHDLVEVLPLIITNFVPKVPGLFKKLKMILQILSTRPLQVLDHFNKTVFNKFKKRKWTTWRTKFLHWEINLRKKNTSDTSFKGCVRYIFASLFCKSKREHLQNKEKCFLLHFKSSSRSWDIQLLTF